MAGKKQPEKVGNDIYGVKSNWKASRRLGETAETGFRHNDHYHKYFHGYTEVRTEKSGGGYKIKRIYTDNWYVKKLSDKTYYIMKAVYLCLCLFACVLFCWLMSRPYFDGNYVRAVAVVELISLLCLGLLTVSVTVYLFTKRRMTWWEYYSSSHRIKRYSLAATIGQIFTAVFIIVNMFQGVESVKRECMLAMGICVCAAATFTLFLLEEKALYEEEENRVNLPKGELHKIL